MQTSNHIDLRISQEYALNRSVRALDREVKVLAGETAEILIIETKEMLFDHLITLSRPDNASSHNLEEAYDRLIDVLNAALETKVIDDELLRGILEYILRHHEQIREHRDRGVEFNYWRFHNDFCLNLRAVVFPSS